MLSKLIKVFQKTFITFLLMIFSIQLFASDKSAPDMINIVAPISAPFVFKNEQGEAQGFLVELLSLVKQKTGINTHVSIMPWSRAMLEVKSGHMDALMPTIYTDERAQFLIYQNSLFLNLIPCY